LKIYDVKVCLHKVTYPVTSEEQEEFQPKKDKMYEFFKTNGIHLVDKFESIYHINDRVRFT